MYISHVEISNFRALQSVSVPLNQFSVLIGENDVGKTSFLYALEKFFLNKKLTDSRDWFKKETENGIKIALTFNNLPDSTDFNDIKRADNSIVVRKIFPFEKPPKVKAVLEDESEIEIKSSIINTWFSSDNFHLIPVRRDLDVQFSMKKTALLGKTLRAMMKNAIKERDTTNSVETIGNILTESIAVPQNTMEAYLKEQLHNDAIKLEFTNLVVDPVEGVTFDVSLDDDRAEDILMHNRGAGTQNNLIIALFRLIADLNIGSYLIFAMEEPENSLHPKAQRQLLSVIQKISQSSQVIVTTHSPVFIDRSNFEHNILLTRTINGDTIAKTFDTVLLTQVRADIGIRASDALLKGGGNCAILVEGSTEEDGFPTFMEMLGMSEFQLGIAIINMEGSDDTKVPNIVKLLSAYDIPCVVVLDNDAKKTEEELNRRQKNSLPNIKKVFCLKRGTIEDYYPLDIVAEVVNKYLSPKKNLTASDFDDTKHGKKRLENFDKVMWDNDCGSALKFLKRLLGSQGTLLMKEQELEVDPELAEIFNTVRDIANET